MRYFNDLGEYNYTTVFHMVNPKETIDHEKEKTSIEINFEWECHQFFYFFLFLFFLDNKLEQFK